MAKQLSLMGHTEDDAAGMHDCVRYEEIQDLWKTDLPSDSDVDWCAEHVRLCATGVHALERHAPAARSILSALAKLDEAETTEMADPGASSWDAETETKDFAQEGRRLLESAGAIERGEYDYLLPCGQHSDTHVNAAKLCWSQSVIGRTAGFIARMLADLEFDTIVSTSWPMATIARRFLRSSSPRLEHVVAEGYPPAFLGPIRPGSRVVILTDVIVTGGLTRSIQEAIQRREGRVVKCVTLATPEAPPSGSPHNVATLCRIPMTLQAPGSCPRCHALPLKEFNPLASEMTLRKKQSRSPAQFLAENREAADFWQIVERTGAYERHHRRGSRHYVAFVDTVKLLSQPEVGAQLVVRLRDLILSRTRPDVLLAPDRAPARLLAQKLLEAMKGATPNPPLELVVASRRGPRRALPGTITLEGRRVLLVDSAADHGDTLDELALLAASRGASEVGVAVLLSRLRAGSEEAFDARLAGGFVSLFSLPIPGFRTSCPVCDRYDAWRENTHCLPPGPARDLLVRLTQRANRRPSGPPDKATQLSLFVEHSLPIGELLTKCKRRVAGGIALHALYAARGDGMAPLSLAEVFDERIPVNNRIGLVEALPTGVLKRTEPTLKRELERYLLSGENPRLWLSVADVFVREGLSEWVDGLGRALRRQAPWTSDEQFWVRLSAVSLQGRQQPRPDTHACLEELAEEFKATPAESKLRELRAIIQP